LREEILLAKKILKDPNLSLMASRKFNGTIDKKDPDKLVVTGAVITELIET
jgi:hypothetical protein